MSQKHPFKNTTQPYLVQEHQPRNKQKLKHGCVEHQKSLDDPEDFLEPFLEDNFEPFKWTYILATLSVCTNEITQIKFYDGNGDEIIPLCTINAYTQALKEGNSKDTLLQLESILVDYIHKNEISTQGKDSSEKDKQEKTYDASSKSKERTQPQ